MLQLVFVFFVGKKSVNAKWGDGIMFAEKVVTSQMQKDLYCCTEKDVTQTTASHAVIFLSQLQTIKRFVLHRWKPGSSNMSFSAYVLR